MTYAKSQFRVTPWPQMPLPHPDALGGFPYMYSPDADALLPDWDAARAGQTRPGPATSETYLKLAALDPDDTVALVDFVVGYGQLDMRGDHTLYSVPDAGAFAFRADKTHPVLEAAFDRAAAVAGVGGFGDTLTEIRWAILYMRDLIAAWRAVNGQLDATTHSWEAPFWSGMSDLDSPPWTPEGAPTTLSLAIDLALGPYSPKLRMFAEEDGPPEGIGLDFGTWTLCCVELFNHILEEATYKTCANEKCGRLFVRQEGRAAHGQHRTKGVKYCSSSCARAQVQRQYRRTRRPQT